MIGAYLLEELFLIGRGLLLEAKHVRDLAHLGKAHAALPLVAKATAWQQAGSTMERVRTHGTGMGMIGWVTYEVVSSGFT